MTQSELRELKAIGAELGAAKAENDRLRGLLQQVVDCQAEHYGDGCGLHLSMITLAGRIKDALSQQPEPADTYTAVDMATAAAQGVRDGQAAAGQDTAQDEREAVKQAIAEALGEALDCTRVWSAWSYGTMRPNDFQLVAEDDGRLDEIADAAISAMTTRPVQTEQQPVWWIHEDELPEGYPYDAMFPFSKVDVVRMFPVYAPIAQTAPQGKFRMGDRVKKSTGSEWVGRVVGWYSTEQTPEGYAVESSAHRNSVQIYPVTALEAVE